MKAQQKNLRKITVLAAMVLLSFTACTKKKEMTSLVSPDHAVAKADYEGKIFSLVRGIEDADGNNVVGATPGMSQDFGFVKARITDTEIQFVEVYNLGKTEATKSIVASYAIKDHFDIARETNDFGESTNKTVEKKDRPMKDRAFMRVDWSAPTNKQSKLATSTDLIDAPAENVVLLEAPAKDETGHISWLTEFSAEGQAYWWSVSPNSRVVVRTHLMPVKASDFQRLNYRDSDFKRFGYFFTQQNLEDPEKGPLDSQLEDHTFANMHNVCEPGRTDAAGKPLSCSTNKIVWYLTKKFPDKYLAVTRRAVVEWNDTFKTALGRTDDVVVLDESRQVDLVDPRYNTIAHYGEKSSGGLLGVAQWASNPETGELIATRATVYEDGIRGTLGKVDDIISLILSDDEVRQAFLATDDETRERVDRIFKKNSGQSLKGKMKKMRSSARMTLGLKPKAEVESARKASDSFEVRKSVGAIANSLREPVSKGIARKANLMSKAPDFFATSEASRLGQVAGFDQAFGLLGAKKPSTSRLPQIGGLEHLHDVGSGLREERLRMMNQAHTGIHGAELVEEAAIRYIKSVLAAHPEAADFKSQVETIKAEVDQKTFYTTLVHEMGHAFGLRHNFQGSADAKHYHPEFYRLSKQMELEKKLPEDQKTVTVADLEPYMFSSIMDYGGDFYSQIGGIGPYDKAAIRYAYNRSIDKAKDSVVTDAYQFCTDHQVNETILCRRFDKGRNATEITFNLIETYQTNWVLSHYRRDRANFEGRARAFPYNALVRYFVPVRQVMDEFLYALIKGKPVAAKENECDIDYWKRSVDKAEIANICNPLEAESVGVDPTNIETFEMALFNAEGELRKSPDQLEPYGLADLLLANLMAKQFFGEVLGSTTPGKYIVLQGQQKGTFDLERLPEGSMDEALTAFASERGIPMSDDLMGQLKNISGEIKVGRYAKGFDSEWDESGSAPFQKSIGSFWDKYVAMIALGIKDVGVQKYYTASMTGNAYAYPHTNGFAKQIIKSMITQNDRIVRVPFKVPAGTVMASVPPMLNADVRAIATITALTDFISDGDETIADKMRVCSVDEQGCRKIAGKEVVEFTSASGQDVYRSAQTQNDDSIAFELLTAASVIDKQRQEWVTKAGEASNIAADNIMKMASLEPQREPLEKTLAALNIADLNQILPVLLGTDPKKLSMWQITNILAAQADAVPLFTTMTFAQQAADILNGAGQIIDGEAKKLDPESACKAQAAQVSTESAKLPTVIGLDGKLKVKSTLSAILGQEKSKTLAGPSAPTAPAAAPKADCAAIAPRLKELTAAQGELAGFANVINEVLNAAVEVKTAPLRAKRLTDELSRAEANIKFIRKVSKATGLE